MIKFFVILFYTIFYVSFITEAMRKDEHLSQIQKPTEGDDGDNSNLQQHDEPTINQINDVSNQSNVDISVNDLTNNPGVGAPHTAQDFPNFTNTPGDLNPPNTRGSLPLQAPSRSNFPPH